VIDIGSGRLTAVAGTTISTEVAMSFGWQPVSDQLLVIVEGSSTVVHVACWQPGDTRLSIEAARIPSGTSLVLGNP